MSTLLVRLAAPLQSWGADSKFERRTTMREPTKSGVVGMLAAALGRRRGESIDDLAALRFGVRIDQPGQMIRDYHIALADKPYVTERFYLADAVFVAGLEGDASFLNELEAAVNAPVFPLFLGRRSCPPEGKMVMGIYETPLERCLLETPSCASDWYRRRNGSKLTMTVVIDSDRVDAPRRRDVPVSFDPTRRQYAFRNFEDRMQHDPFEQLKRGE